MRKEKCRDEILDLFQAAGGDFGIIRRSFQAEVLAEGVVVPVPVFLPVFLVMLMAVTYEVVQRKSVMTRDEVDRFLRRSSLVMVQIRAPRDSTCKRGQHPVIASPKPSDLVAIFSVPLGPSCPGKGSNLVHAGRVPRFRDQLGVS